MNPPPTSPKGPSKGLLLTKIGAYATVPDRTNASGTAAVPASTQGASETGTYIQTYFTKVPDANETQILYNGDRQWARITLCLETAGPVAVGHQQQLDPVLGGRGILLATNVDRSFVIAKGTRLYIIATAVNRVKMIVEPLPWLEQITGEIAQVVTSLTAMLSRLFEKK